MKLITCKKCTGHYVLRNGKNGQFAGCSHFPQCNATLSIDRLVMEFLNQYGLPIYGWKKRCWKCGSATKVYSYYLDYELADVSDEFTSCEPIGLGDLSEVDAWLSKQFPTIQSRFSQTAGRRYMANTCEHCSALQGRNYVVDDPHEIIEELWHSRGMEPYKIDTHKVEETPQLKKELKKLF